jgi:hypothetical protein
MSTTTSFRVWCQQFWKVQKRLSFLERNPIADFVMDAQHDRAMPWRADFRTILHHLCAVNASL